jgi:outer membrane protein OmpA-like peptidoglycan-associated protein
MTLRAAIGFMLIVLAGCAAQPTVEPAPRLRERIVLLPSNTDRPSAVVVRAGDAELLLDTPYAAADLRETVLEVNALTAASVQQRYGGLLSAQPPQPRPFTMYFELGSDELTATSRAAFENARSTIASWSAVEVVVVGHTDRLGAMEYNDQLSKRRAQVIATRLVASGVPSHAIEVAARGEREPLVPTADGMPEPRNRRVEIKVR